MIRYTEDHEWLRAEGDEVAVGITAHAAEQLGDIVFIELPEVGREVAKGEEVVVIESVKAASDITAPLAGTITEVNEAVSANPGTVNSDAANAWFFKVRAPDADVSGFMDEAAYNAMVG